LEILETLGVPVIGFRCDEFPGFYLRASGELVSARAETAAEASALVKANWALGGKGVVLAQPVAEEFALDEAEFKAALVEAEGLAYDRGIRGPGLTPFLLARIAELTDGKTLRANKELVIANARLGAELACALRDVI